MEGSEQLRAGAALRAPGAWAEQRIPVRPSPATNHSISWSRGIAPACCHWRRVRSRRGRPHHPVRDAARPGDRGQATEFRELWRSYADATTSVEVVNRQRPSARCRSRSRARGVISPCAAVTGPRSCLVDRDTEERRWCCLDFTTHVRTIRREPISWSRPGRAWSAWGRVGARSHPVPRCGQWRPLCRCRSVRGPVWKWGEDPAWSRRGM